VCTHSFSDSLLLYRRSTEDPPPQKHIVVLDNLTCFETVTVLVSKKSKSGNVIHVWLFADILCGKATISSIFLLYVMYAYNYTHTYTQRFSSCHTVSHHVTLFLFMSHCFSSCHTVSLNVTLSLSMSHCFSLCHTVSLHVTLFLLMSHCLS